MIIIVILAVTLGVFLLYCFSRPANEEPQETLETMPELKKPVSENDSFKISGISHHCYRGDIGLVSGETIDDPENKYDKNAVMIVDANKEKILGYIAKGDQRRYRSLAKSRPRMPFVGYIEKYHNEEGEVCLFGVIRVYSNDNEDALMSDLNSDWDYLKHAFRIRAYQDRMDALDRFKNNYR